MQPLFISVDPSRDTVGQLKHYGQDFHKNLIYLTGTKDQVAAAAKAYRVYFSKLWLFEYVTSRRLLIYIARPSMLIWKIKKNI